MTISTQDCKDFINKIGHLINTNNEKWKRTKKYKQGTLVLRDFESESGRKLTVAENNGKLFLYQLQALTMQSVSESTSVVFGKRVFSKQPTDKEVLQFMVDCVNQDHSIVDGSDKQTLKDALNIKSWTIWQKWTDNIKHNNDYDEESLEEFIDDDWHDFTVYCDDPQILNSCLNPDDIKQVFWLGMSDYDTAYRIYIYQTKDNTLYLGENDPD